MTQDVLAFVHDHVKQGQLVALITVTNTSGSSPASTGQIMAVLEDGTTSGTVGGGASEYRLIQSSIDALKRGDRAFEFEFDHAENGMICGGAMRGYVTIFGNESHLYIFGGGHIAQSLAKVALLSGFAVTVIEDRPEYASEFSGVRYLTSSAEHYAQQVSFTRNAYAVICTRGHKWDDAALRFCLEKPLQYIGMIGSAKKVQTLLQGLQTEGFSNDKLENLYTPIGLNIASEIPAEIAISIMAEILLIKNHGTPSHKRAYSN